MQQLVAMLPLVLAAVVAVPVRTERIVSQVQVLAVKVEMVKHFHHFLDQVYIMHHHHHFNQL